MKEYRPLEAESGVKQGNRRRRRGGREEENVKELPFNFGS
jgi:hypothetical protein